MRIKTIILSSLLLVSTLSYGVAPITPQEHETLMKGEAVQNVVWKDGYVWPEVTVRVLVNHAPEASMNIFTDYESQPKFIPDLLKAKVVKKISPENVHVFMAMKMPWPVNESTHTTNNVLSKSADGSYTLKWNLEGKATFLKATDGYCTFKPYNGKTLMEYVTFIVPNSSFAGMFKNKVAGDVMKTVTSITQRLDKVLPAEEKKKL
jgi:ribosome-associated toxin RatA of RatAB toxin-antitoxin module